MAEAKAVFKSKEKRVLTEAEKAAGVKAKGQKFVEMAQKRVGKALQSIKLIGNLASPNYVYNTEQADKIVNVLQLEIDTLYEAFKAKKGKEKVTFTL